MSSLLEINKRSPHLGCAFTKHKQGVPPNERKLMECDRVSPFRYSDGMWLSRVYRWWRADWTFVGMVKLPPDPGLDLPKYWERSASPNRGEEHIERGRVPAIKVDRTKYRGDNIIDQTPPSQGGMRFSLIDSRYGIWRAENSRDVYCGTIVDVVLWANTPTLDCPALYI